MKVLHLISSGDFGGAKLHVISLVKELGKHIDVKLISFRAGLFSEEAQAAGINVEVVNTGSFLSDVRRIKQLIREEGYEIIHCHGAKANTVAVMVRRSIQIPVVTTVHSDYRLDYMESTWRRFTYGTINTVALRMLDYYIGVSENFRQMLIDRGFKPEKIFTVYNGMDFDVSIPQFDRNEFLSKYNIHVPADVIMVGILARLHPVKDISTLIRAAAQVLKQAPSTVFIIGGDGDDRDQLVALAKELGVADKVFFPGFVSDPNQFMSAIDINVLTSISESFPYVIMEGARVKKPIVCTDVGGISMLVKNGENGFLLTPGDDQTLASHLLRLIQDPELRKTMGEAIYQSASRTYSLKNMCATQLDIYSKIKAAHTGKR